MNKSLSALFVSLVAALALCGCSTSYSPSDPIDEESGKATTVVVYQGHDLFCLEETIAYDKQTYTCDFAAFYGQPPVTGSKLPAAKVGLTTIPYRGKKLTCFQFATSHDNESYTCDFERFYRENQGVNLPLPG